MYNQKYKLITSVLESIDDITLLIDCEGYILYLSSELFQIFNIDRLEGQLIGSHVGSLFVQLNISLSKNDKPFALKNKTDFEDEILIHNKQKYSRKFKKILDADLNEIEFWKLNYISSLSVDFHNSFINTLNTDILNIIPADIALFNLQHQYLFVNNVGVKSNDIKKWLIGKDDFDYCEYTGKSINIAETRRKHFNIAVKTGNQVDFEEETILKDGTSQTHLRIFLPIKNTAGEVIIVAGYGINISTTKLIERQNQLFFKKIEELFDNSTSIILTVNGDGLIKNVNTAFEQFYNISKNEICNQTNLSYFFFSDNADNKIADENQVLKTISPKGITHQFKIQIIESLISFDNSANKYYFLSDITNDIIIKNQLYQQLDHDRKLNVQKSNFISMVSHELRTPLSIILSNVEILQILINKAQDNQSIYQKNFDKIFFQINKMVEMIGKYLFLNKLEALLYKPEQDKIVLRDFIADIVSEEYSPWIDGRNLKYIFKANHKNSAHEIFEVNKDNLKVVISNLLENALKYSAESTKAPILRISVKDKYYSILIIDFGIGIIKSEHSLIFKPFARGSNVENIRGSGFGLMFVNQFVEYASGKLLIRSTRGKYTIINIQIPLINIS